MGSAARLLDLSLSLICSNILRNLSESGEVEDRLETLFFNLLFSALSMERSVSIETEEEESMTDI
jgi:hypothetical protein